MEVLFCKGIFFPFSFADESQLVEQPRAEFKGEKRISPITGLPEPYYPTWKRRVKMYCVSFPLLLICLIFAVFGMWLYLDFQQILKNRYENQTGFIVAVMMRVPSIFYGAAIFVVNTAYSRFATKLNDWGKAYLFFECTVSQTILSNLNLRDSSFC